MLACAAAAGYDGRVRLLMQALLLVAVGALGGMVANALSPHPARLDRPVRTLAEETGACKLPGAPGLIPQISVQDATPLCFACSAAFVDARSAIQYASGHVAGAIHLPPGDVPPKLLLQLERYGTVVVYDGNASSGRAEQVASALKAHGLTDVRLLSGAWPAWIAAGAPGESGPCGSCVADDHHPGVDP
jgi:rhodanese-related sulfurtransferase